METYPLYAHPAAGSLRVSKVECSLKRPRSDLLILTYRIEAKPSDVVIPRGYGLRRDGLWKSTCLELFLGKAGSLSYREFNFSPLGDWAGYEFLQYRQGQRNITSQAEPSFKVIEKKDSFSVIVWLSVEGLDEGDPFSVSAVIDERDFGLSYWSYWHTGDMPDFHHPSCFKARLPAPEAP